MSDDKNKKVEVKSYQDKIKEKVTKAKVEAKRILLSEHKKKKTD